MAIRGKALTPEIKKSVVSTKKYFDLCRSFDNARIPSVQRVADAMCIGIATVKRIMADYNRDPNLLERPPSDRGRKSYSIDASFQEKARAYIREANSNGSYITLGKIHEFLMENALGGSFHTPTLSGALDRWEFVFRKGTG